MGRPRKWRQKSIAYARAFKSSKLPDYSSPSANKVTAGEDSDIEILEYTCESILADGEDDNEVTRWTGGVNHDPEMDGSDFSWWEDTSVTDDSESGDSDGPGSTSGADSEDEDAWRGRLQKEIEHEIQLLNEPSPFEVLMVHRTQEDWKKAESNRSLGYNGNSGRNQRRRDKKARDKEDRDAKLRKT